MNEGAPLAGLRVLHVSTVHRLSDPRIRLKECRTLTEAGATVRLVARSSPIDVDDEVDAIALPTYQRRFERVWKGQRDALRAVREFKPDVVHFHDPELLATAPLLRRLVPHVFYDVHESLPDLVLDRDWIPLPARTAVSALCRRIEPLLARACAAYVFVDERWADRFADRPWIEVGNPPLAGEFEPVDRLLPPDRPHFVYVGELLPERGVHSAVRAVNALEVDAQLTLAGPVSDSLADELRALDTSGRLSLPGLVSRQVVAELLASATAGLVLLEPVPAYDDATATKLYEYLAAGVPMILSSTTAQRRFADTHGCALVTTYDDEVELASAMTRIGEPGQWQRLRNAAQSAEVPSWQTHAAPQLVQLYEGLQRD